MVVWIGGGVYKWRVTCRGGGKGCWVVQVGLGENLFHSGGPFVGYLVKAWVVWNGTADFSDGAGATGFVACSAASMLFFCP